MLLQRDDASEFIDYQYTYSDGTPVNTPLVATLREMRSDTPQIVRMLLESGADANRASDFGTPLRAALFRRDSQKIGEESVKLLIEYGADVKDSRYLPLAFKNASKETIELLIHKGAYNGSEEQKEEILKAALRREVSESDKRDEEYEEILQMALGFKPNQKSLDEALTEALQPNEIAFATQCKHQCPRPLWQYIAHDISWND